MRRVWVLTLMICTAAGAALVAFRHHSPEPVYAGRRLTEWLDSGAEPAAMAVHEIGPAATPWILRKVRREHPRWGWWQAYQESWIRTPFLIRKALPKPRVAGYDEFKAAMVLVETGPRSIPQLRHGLREKNPGVKMACALALGAWSERGRGDRQSREALREALLDKHPEVRQAAAAAIAKGESRPPP
jgi:hypothetical protein